VQPGSRVMTTSGVHAVVVSVEEPSIVVLEIAPGVHTRWARQAIAEVHEPGPEPASDPAPDQAMDQVIAAEPVVDVTDEATHAEALTRPDDRPDDR
jgi:preprotein translocase subunit YajC